VATPYAELGDLQALFPRELPPAEEARAEALLEKASFWLGVWVPELVGSTDEAVLEAAKYIVIDMVTRSLLSTAAARPDGAESVSRTAGVYGESIKFRDPDGNLFLYARELEDLEGLIRGCRSKAVSYPSPGL
jgi:hypothetical protein